MNRGIAMCDGCISGLVGGAGAGALGFALAVAFAPITDIIRPSIEWAMLIGLYGAIAGGIFGCMVGALVGLTLANTRFRIGIGLITGFAMAWFVMTYILWVQGTAWSYALSVACIVACIASAHVAGLATTYHRRPGIGR